MTNLSIEWLVFLLQIRKVPARLSAQRPIVRDPFYIFIDLLFTVILKFDFI
jgi:hypothetical protein